jgi:hypothetical protein
MSTEIVVATVGAAGVVGGALVSAVPAVLSMRRARNATEAEGTATRGSVDVLGARLAERIDAVKNELRSDVADLHREVAEVRDWQSAHSTAHTLVRISDYRQRERSTNRGTTPNA